MQASRSHTTYTPSPSFSPFLPHIPPFPQKQSTQSCSAGHCVSIEWSLCFPCCRAANSHAFCVHFYAISLSHALSISRAPSIYTRAIVRDGIRMRDNYRMVQPTQWVPAILDEIKKVKSSISTVVLAPSSSSDSSLVVHCIFL